VRRSLVLLGALLAPTLVQAQAPWRMSSAAPLLGATYAEVFRSPRLIPARPEPLQLGSFRPARPSFGRTMARVALELLARDSFNRWEQDPRLPEASAPETRVSFPPGNLPTFSARIAPLQVSP
jgi:hypothetical protein